MKLTYVTNGDRWKALYVDGKMKTQGHYAASPEQVARICIEKNIDEFEKLHIYDRGDYARAEFPSTLEEAREDEIWELK